MVPFSVVTGPEAWVAADYPSPSTYTYVFTPEDIAELDSAVAAVVQTGLDIKVSPPVHRFCSGPNADFVAQCESLWHIVRVRPCI